MSDDLNKYIEEIDVKMNDTRQALGRVNQEMMRLEQSMVYYQGQREMVLRLIDDEKKRTAQAS